ncbi:DNA helicase [Tanacetum coccineum]
METIISALRSERKFVLAVASSGVTSLLLPSGRTEHSRFKLLIELTEESLCKSVLLGGDIRQTLLVKKGASKMEIITSCISQSNPWPHFRVFTLTENMRLLRPDVSADERSLITSFASWLLDIRDGKTGEADQQDPEKHSWIEIPHHLPPFQIMNNKVFSNLI